MPIRRMRMRDWLERKIESKTVHGLKWVDKREKIFCIPWKHAASQAWNLETDAVLFKEWAIYTGKYTEGDANADPKTWKVNFRNAMNSLPDIEEVKDQSINRGQQAVRVFRMLEVIKKSKDKKSRGKNVKQRNKRSKAKEEGSGSSATLWPAHCHTQAHMPTFPTQENNVDRINHQDCVSMDTPDLQFGIPELSYSTCDLNRNIQISPQHSSDFTDNDYYSDLLRPVESPGTDTGSLPSLSFDTSGDSSPCSSQGSETFPVDAFDMIFPDLESITEDSSFFHLDALYNDLTTLTWYH